MNLNLKVNKSTDLDKIPANVLWLSADIIAPSLTYIFNLLLDTGIYVDDCMETCASNSNLQIWR
jgi:hypothetical protein